MTGEQKAHLKAVKEHLQAEFEAALETMSEPGSSRTWFLPYLCELLRAYNKLRETKISGKRLTKAIGSSHRERFLKLIKRTTNRDPKTCSRWAAAMANAIKEGIDPDDLEDWLKDGGGIAGRARVKKARQPSAQTEHWAES